MISETTVRGEALPASNAYGRFDPETKAFVITDIFTPRPWVNVMSNDRYGLVVSQMGGGFSWYENCQTFRISRWEQDLVRDEMGRAVYILDLDAPNETWSTTYQPTRRKAEREQVTHGLGYTTFERRFLGLETKQTVFVPQDGDVEVWIVEIRNLADRSRRLRAASYQELHLGGIGDWHREFHRLFTESRVIDGQLIAWKHPNLREHRRDALEAPVRAGFAWNGADEVRWITDKAAWLGRGGSPDRPQGLTSLPPTSDTPRWDDPVAVGAFDLELEPGEVKTFVHVVAAGRDVESLQASLRRYHLEAAKMALAATQLYWRDRCGRNPIATCDADVDVMVNAWLPYQAIAGRIYARCAYYQQGGAYGYRDQLQDSLIFLDLEEPQNTLAQLRKHAEAMYEDGGVRHWWHPGTDIFASSRHSDTCLWLAYGVLAYVEATGDLASLDQSLGFLSRETESVGTSGTLLEHCRRGIARALRQRSDRGIPLIGAGDWNDGLSHAGLEGKGESFWLGMFLFDILRRFAPVLRRLGKGEEAARFEEAAEDLRVAVNRHGWDGEWYLAGTRDDGGTLGSANDAQGSIFLNPQTWAVLTGIAPPDRAEQAMRAVRERLLTPYGALLLRPAFSKVDPYVGYITRYAPGLRENGGVYSHASTWAALAFARLGDRETATAIFRGMLPPLRSAEGADLYAAEPYVTPGNVDGPDSPYEGRAGWTWYTGSAAWLRRVARELFSPSFPRL